MDFYKETDYAALSKSIMKEIKEKKKPEKPVDSNLEFHKLLRKTIMEIEPYRFTDTPYWWSKKNHHKDIGFALEKAETNFHFAILEKHIDEAKYWAIKMVNEYKKLYDAYLFVIKKKKG